MLHSPPPSRMVEGFRLPRGAAALRPGVVWGAEVLYEQKLNPYPFPILLPATIGSKTYLFELDTGASMDIVDPALEPLLGAYKENVKVGSFGRIIEMDIFRAPAITIGGWRLPPSIAGVSEMYRFRIIFGVDIRGYIGVSALKDCLLALNFDRKRMRIVTGHGATQAGMESLDLNSENNAPPRFRADLLGRPVNFLIDTGATHHIGLKHDAFAAMSETGAIKLNPGRRAVQTGAGQVFHRTGHFTEGELLGVNLAGIPVDETNMTNTIGLGFLLNFNSAIDLKRARFWYQRRKAVLPIYKNAFSDAGITFPGCRNYIYWLDPRGPSAAAGLRPGDHIVRLGPLKEGDINAFSISKLFLDHAGESVEVQVLHSGDDKATTLTMELPEKELAYP